MKTRILSVMALTFPLVVFAADEAPPNELLENLEFFQNFDLVKDQQFLVHANRDEAAIAPSSGTLVGKGVSDADL